MIDLDIIRIKVIKCIRSFLNYYRKHNFPIPEITTKILQTVMSVILCVVMTDMFDRNSPRLLCVAWYFLSLNWSEHNLVPESLLCLDIKYTSQTCTR